MSTNDTTPTTRETRYEIVERIAGCWVRWTGGAVNVYATRERAEIDVVMAEACCWDPKQARGLFRVRRVR